MSEPRVFFVSYEGEMTDEDRQELSRPDWKLYENGMGFTAAYVGQEWPPVTWRQIVRLSARDGDEAKRLVIDALGREPYRLRAAAAKQPDE